MIKFRKNIDFDTTIESHILGYLITHYTNNAYEKLQGVLIEECFYNDSCRQLYKAMDGLFHEGRSMDMISLISYLYKNGIEAFNKYNAAYFVSELCGLGSGFIPEYTALNWAIILREMAAQREMIKLKNSGTDIDDVFIEAANIEKQLKKILDVKNTDDWESADKVAIKLYEHMQSQTAGSIPGIELGIAEIDRANGGVRNGNLIILAARPSVGKSAVAGHIAKYVAKKGKSVGIISLEMANKDLMKRMLSEESDTEYYKIDRNAMRMDEAEYVYQKLSDIGTLPLYFSDSPEVNSTDIKIKAGKLKAKGKLDFLIIDYLQLVEPTKEDEKKIREQQVAKISRDLKKLAMTLDIPIMILAQLNRGMNTEKTKKPELHHLRESGSLEQDADVVMFVHNPFKLGEEKDANGESWENKIQILVRKWRNGKSDFETTIGYEPDKMKFYELNTDTPPPSPSPFNSIKSYDNPDSVPF